MSYNVILGKGWKRQAGKDKESGAKTFGFSVSPLHCVEVMMDDMKYENNREKEEDLQEWMRFPARLLPCPWILHMFHPAHRFIDCSFISQNH